jgi:hypothetical protein
MKSKKNVKYHQLPEEQQDEDAKFDKLGGLDDPLKDLTAFRKNNQVNDS